MNGINRIKQIAPVCRVIRHRFIKFSIVGSSGVIVNLTVLYTSQEMILRAVYPSEVRLRFSLALAIFVATINNYLWNRSWTWGDRKENRRFVFWRQMGQYFIACALAIVLQFVLTILFAHFIHYLIANILAIILAAIFNYVINDIWTFAVRKLTE